MSEIAARGRSHLGDRKRPRRYSCGQPQPLRHQAINAATGLAILTAVAAYLTAAICPAVDRSGARCRLPFVR
jgi:hypothetical protein